jgi:hypothetical protein
VKVLLLVKTGEGIGARWIGAVVDPSMLVSSDPEVEPIVRGLIARSGIANEEIVRDEVEMNKRAEFETALVRAHELLSQAGINHPFVPTEPHASLIETRVADLVQKLTDVEVKWAEARASLDSCELDKSGLLAQLEAIDQLCSVITGDDADLSIPNRVAHLLRVRHPINPEKPSKRVVDAIRKKIRTSIEAQLPEDETDTVPAWVLDLAIAEAIKAYALHVAKK